MSVDEEGFITSRRRLAIVLAVLAVAACGDEPAQKAPPPAPSPPPQTTAPVAPDVDQVPRGEHRVKDLLESCKRECVDAFRMQDPDEKAVLARLKTVDAKPSADEAEWTELSATVARIRARDARLKSDPRFLEAERKANWVRENPMFRDVALTRVFVDPYVIFQEVKTQDVRDVKKVYNERQGAVEEAPIDGTANPAKVRQNELWAKKGELFAKRDAALFTEMHRRFRELFADEFKLPTLAEKERLLTVLVMWNRASFDAMLQETGGSVDPDIRGFYSPRQQKVFAYLGDEALQGVDELPCEGDFIQKESDQALIHSAARQLRHEYAAIARGRPLTDGETSFDERPSAWLDVGLAEFLSAVEVDQSKVADLRDVAWRHERVLLHRVLEASRDRDDAERWTIAALMKPTTGSLETVDVANLGGPVAATLFSARAWAFVHFLWNYDAGKYRGRFLEFVGRSLREPTTSAQFATSMGRTDAADWGPIEREFEWYWTRLLDRQIGKDKKTGTWAKPSTDAPTGRVEDDAEFCRRWNEGRPPRGR